LAKLSITRQRSTATTHKHGSKNLFQFSVKNKTKKHVQKRFVLFRVRRQVVEESIEEGCFTTGNILS